MLDVAVIEDPGAAMAALDPIRARLLAELLEPASAATLAARVGLPRQKVNYHLRALEHHKLVEPAEERRWGGLTERLMVATAAAYVVSPAALGPAAVDPARSRDRLAASYRDRAGGAHRAGSERPVAWGPPGRQAAGDTRDRHGDPVPVAGRSRRVHARSDGGHHHSDRPLSPRNGAARAPPSPRHRVLPGAGRGQLRTRHANQERRRGQALGGDGVPRARHAGTGLAGDGDRARQ